MPYGSWLFDSRFLSRGVVGGLALICCLLAGAAWAQNAGCDTSAAPSLEYERYAAEEWPQEAARFNSNRQSVSRADGRLRLALEGVGSVELTDCPYGDTANTYLYERYDEAGRFYVVRTPTYEDFSYTLVMRKTGKTVTVYGMPVWAQDKSRFLTVACSLLPERGTLTVHVPEGDGLRVEGEIALPCGSESCSARWDHASWISVSCTPWSEESKGKKGTEFVLLRGKEGWRRFGR
jgi:hypothetical protein